LWGDVPVAVAASRTNVPSNVSLPQDNAHLNDHSWFHHAGKFQRIDGFAIFCTYHLIVTSFDEAIPDAVFAVPIDNIVKILSVEQR
jgi:hypothetical protein